jgi:hypothetical protein
LQARFAELRESVGGGPDTSGDLEGKTHRVGPKFAS